MDFIGGFVFSNFGVRHVAFQRFFITKNNMFVFFWTILSFFFIFVEVKKMRNVIWWRMVHTKARPWLGPGRRPLGILYLFYFCRLQLKRGLFSYFSNMFLQNLHTSICFLLFFFQSMSIYMILNRFELNLLYKIAMKLL